MYGGEVAHSACVHLTPAETKECIEKYTIVRKCQKIPFCMTFTRAFWSEAGAVLLKVHFVLCQIVVMKRI